jgi:NTP pyrophosphatase (non-canonical NTP hydrolase)
MHDFYGLQKASHSVAKEKGWWDKERGMPECIALMHSELSEALEEVRKGSPAFYTVGDNPKPEGWAVEFADCVIRIMDVCELHNVNLEKILIEKMKYNETRPYKHGKLL